MRRYVSTLFIALTAISAVSIAGLAHPPASAPPRSVRWAADVTPSWSGRLNILHAPDNRTTTVDPPLTITQFGTPMRYPDFGSLLTAVPAADLARTDVIAFEGNGGHGAGIDIGWESSIWTFSDGVNTRTVYFNECLGAAGSDPRIVATGSIKGPDGSFLSGNAAYSAFFGLCSPDPNNPVVSYILFDLHSISPAIDTSSPYFSISIENYYIGPPMGPGDCLPGHTGEGSPDPDAVGIFTTCSGK